MPLALLAVLLLAAVQFVVLARRAWLARHPAPATAPVPAAADTTTARVRTVTLWFASPDADSLVSESRKVPEQSELHARLAALVSELAAGPGAGAVPTLPAGTTLLHAYLDDAGLLTLDLSLAFRQGFAGGARAEELVLGSLVRTVSSNVGEAKRIRIVCAGAPLATLGGHFPLDQPLDPQDWP